MSWGTKTTIIALLTFVGATCLAAGTAGAQSSESDGYGPVPTTVSPTTVLPPVEPEVLSETLERGAGSASGADASNSAGASSVSSGLAFTGGDIAGLSVIGVFAVAAGGAILMARRNKAVETL